RGHSARSRELVRRWDDSRHLRIRVGRCLIPIPEPVVHRQREDETGAATDAVAFGAELAAVHLGQLLTDVEAEPEAGDVRLARVGGAPERTEDRLGRLGGEPNPAVRDPDRDVALAAYEGDRDRAALRR